MNNGNVNRISNDISVYHVNKTIVAMVISSPDECAIGYAVFAQAKHAEPRAGLSIQIRLPCSGRLEVFSVTTASAFFNGQERSSIRRFDEGGGHDGIAQAACSGSIVVDTGPTQRPIRIERSRCCRTNLRFGACLRADRHVDAVDSVRTGSIAWNDDRLK
ncbi:hypothetical protein [Burkholderia sp. Ac-20344]|uniref:hypothetical protein n=1 Tax=Burkholderia sp. Ac-20344 TaxID=2703890 RepID=UPI00197C883B|nr:hypothetical protein [Burkholderia sp. Ac-20344]MBN3837282.1 hypothetical protein [Burkholderia sp. Ac-20344]